MKKQSLEKNSKMEINEKKSDEKPIALNWYHSGIKDDKYHMFAEVVWRVDAQNKDKTKKAVEEYVEKYLGKDSNKKSISIDVVKVNKVAVIFNVDKWMRENFLKAPKVEFQIPRTLIWTFKKDLPNIVKSRIMWQELERYISSNFKDFLKDHQKRIFEKKLKLAKKLNFNWFDFVVDLKMKKIYVSMKVTIMMTLAIGAYTVASMGKNKKIDSFKEYDL